MDDPRLSIKKISFCGVTGILLVAGSAGQIVISKLNEDAVTDKEIKVSCCGKNSGFLIGELIQLNLLNIS